jgi:hypothetical protein
MIQKWQGDLRKGGGVFFIAHASDAPTNIQIGACAVSNANFTGSTRSRIEPIFLLFAKGSAVNGKIKDLRIIKGQILNPIAVMDIPVQNEDTIRSSSIRGVLGRDGNVVEITKACNNDCVCQSKVNNRKSHD